MARRNSSWLLGLFPVANMGCNPSMVIPPQMSTSRLLGKPARVQRQHRLALSPTRRRCIHFTPEANPNLRPKRTQIYARSEPKFTPEANPCPIKTFACEKNVPTSNTNMTPVTNHLQLAASLGSLTLLNFPAAKISWTACLGYESPTEIDHRFL